MFNNSNVPKLATIALCGLNLIVAVYLTSIAFRPLYSGAGNNKGLPTTPSPSHLLPHVSPGHCRTENGTRVRFLHRSCTAIG